MHVFDSVLDAIGSCASNACGSIGSAAVHAASVSIIPLTLALLAITAMEFARARAWQWILREAFPGIPIPYRVLAATHLVGGGLNAVLPARAGEPVKVYLTKREIPGTTYGALASSLVTLTVFDLALATVGLVVAVQSNLLPTSVLPDVPALGLALGVPLAVVAGAILVTRSVRARNVLSQLRDGVRVLGDPVFYLRFVASWQLLGWILRLVATALFLSAFHLPCTPTNVFLAMAVQSLAGALPFAPSGAGTQQALMVATLTGVSRGSVLFFSIGTQIAMTICSAGLGVAALVFVFKTTGFRALLRDCREGRETRASEAYASSSSSGKAA